MTPRFQKCLEFILRWEGGKVDDPADRGGRTAYGITQKTYDTFRAKRELGSKDVWTITHDEVAVIYQEMYWYTAKCEILPEPLDICVFDAAVQHGPSRSVKFLQQVIDAEPDGNFGPKSSKLLLDALRKESPLALSEDFLAFRKTFYDQIIARDASQKKFQKGWYNRLNDLSTWIGVK